VEGRLVEPGPQDPGDRASEASRVQLRVRVRVRVS